MAGHMGAAKVTTQNLEVVQIDTDKNLLLVKGAGSRIGRGRRVYSCFREGPKRRDW